MVKRFLAFFLVECNKTDAGLNGAHLQDEAFSTACLIDIHDNFVALFESSFDKAERHGRAIPLLKSHRSMIDLHQILELSSLCSGYQNEERPDQVASLLLPCRHRPQYLAGTLDALKLNKLNTLEIRIGKRSELKSSVLIINVRVNFALDLCCASF